MDFITYCSIGLVHVQTRRAFIALQLADFGCGRFMGPAYYTAGWLDTSNAGE